MVSRARDQMTLYMDRIIVYYDRKGRFRTEQKPQVDWGAGNGREMEKSSMDVTGKKKTQENLIGRK